VSSSCSSSSDSPPVAALGAFPAPPVASPSSEEPPEQEEKEAAADEGPGRYRDAAAGRPQRLDGCSTSSPPSQAKRGLLVLDLSGSPEWEEPRRSCCCGCLCCPEEGGISSCGESPPMCPCSCSNLQLSSAAADTWGLMAVVSAAGATPAAAALVERAEELVFPDPDEHPPPPLLLLPPLPTAITSPVLSPAPSSCTAMRCF
jgi:hypothetical protein